MGLGRLVGWRGHFDGMAAGGDRESWKVGVVERGMKSRGGVRFRLKEVGCLSIFVLRGRQVGVQYWKLSCKIRNIACPLRIIDASPMLTKVEWLVWRAQYLSTRGTKYRPIWRSLVFYFLHVVYSSQLQYA